MVSVEWDLDGDGTFESQGQFKKEEEVTVKSKYSFAKPGTYFSVIRVASQRNGNSKTVFTRIQNLDRVRVVVE